MARVITVGAAQLGPIPRSESRSLVVERLIHHLHQARGHGCDLVVFPELCLTTFFPRWFMEDQAEIDSFLCRSYKETVFNFARHRQPRHYRVITERAGAVPPPPEDRRT